jgi:hypothetical protein
MRARSLVPLALCLCSVLAAYACGNGTFPNKLPLYDPDAGPQPSEDSGAPSEDAAEDVTSADASASEAGDAATADAGDAQTKDAGDAEAIDAGDAGALLDAADAGG